MSESKKVLNRISEIIDNIEVNTEDVVDEAGMDAEVWKENSDLLKSLKNKKPLKQKTSIDDEIKNKLSKVIKDPKQLKTIIALVSPYLGDKDYDFK